MDWFLYHNGLRLERVKIMCGGIQKMKIKLMIKNYGLLHQKILTFTLNGTSFYFFRHFGSL